MWKTKYFNCHNGSLIKIRLKITNHNSALPKDIIVICKYMPSTRYILIHKKDFSFENTKKILAKVSINESLVEKLVEI